jgi:magnesium transporter
MAIDIVTLNSKELISNIENIHPSDIANNIKKIKKENKDDFFVILEKIPDDILGDVLLE